MKTLSQEFEMQSQAGRVVVAYDGSEQSVAALEWAATEAQRRRRPLTVMHVLDYWSPVPVPVALAPWSGPKIAMAGSTAREGAARAQKLAGSVEIEALTRVGRVSEVLVGTSTDADLMVVGTPGHGNLVTAVLGSVALSVTAHARCPVVIARGGCEPPGPGRAVVVGVDGSTGSDQALRFAGDLAARSCAPLIIVSAYRTPTLHAWAEARSNLGSNGTADFGAIARHSAETVVAAAAQIVRQTYPELHLSEQIHEARPALALIIAAGARAGLLVVGSRGNDGFAGLRLGSVAHALIHSAPCPVAIVPDTTLVKEPSAKPAAESIEAGIRPGAPAR